MITFVLAVVLIGCNKNQHKLNRVAGKWTVTEVRINGEDYQNPLMEFEFDQCKLKNDGFCEVQLKDNWSFSTTYGIYNITHDGKQLNMSFSEGMYVQNYSFRIKRLNDNKLILENLGAEDNTYERIEMESYD